MRDTMAETTAETNGTGGDRYDVVVVGGGIAGMSAALTLGRSRRRTLVVDSGTPRNAPSSGVHGFLSRDGIPPLELLRIGRDQLAPYPDVEVRSGSVTGGSGEDGDFTVTLGDGSSARAHKLLLASGVVDDLPDTAGFAALWGQGVYHCPYCHGWEVRDSRLAVLAKGPMAMHYLTLIRNWSRDLVLLTDGDAELGEDDRRTLRALGVPVREEPIERLEGVPGDHVGLRQIVFTDGPALERDALFHGPPMRQRSGLAEALGCDIVRELIPMVSMPGTVAHDPVTRQTTVPGVYVAGDAAGPLNAIVAASSGAMAAAFINAALVAAAVAAEVAAAGVGVGVAA
ncbi:MAG: NAD(P)/FAD-dependent oxidoreductase [Thermomicrobiales bacterium]